MYAKAVTRVSLASTDGDVDTGPRATKTLPPVSKTKAVSPEEGSEYDKQALSFRATRDE